jgi:hypothetical protein
MVKDIPHKTAELAKDVGETAMYVGSKGLEMAGEVI